MTTPLPSTSPFTKATLAALNKLGVGSVESLLLHLPLRYVDETHITPIRDLRLGEQAQIQGEITHAEVQYKPRKALIAKLEDASGHLFLRFLHFYPSHLQQLKEGAVLRVLGEPRHGFFGLEMVHPNIRKASDNLPVKETLTPIYPTTAGLSQATLAKVINWALSNANMNETLPAFVYAFGGETLPTFKQSLLAIHHPSPQLSAETLQDRSRAPWRRLAYDELLAQQLSMRRHYAQRYQQTAPKLNAHNTLQQALLQHLPFALTAAQQKVLAEIQTDLQAEYPMQRLLQGDVGSGKTIVATLAALQAIANGYQAALMAPTAILAEQHERKLRDWLSPLGIQIAYLSGSQSKKEREAALQAIAEGAAQLVVGTHALFQTPVEFANLALVIVDEQHRFGVEQRLQLRQKGRHVHQLMMSATPIPRTLSMSYFADLEVSTIDALPPGRTPIVTKLVADSRREEVLERVRQACQQGAQAYWVCPLIEESEALQLQTATETYEHMQAVFPELQIGLVHGRMKPAEKQAVMQRFLSNDIQLLVATTVIEVGVDVPNASLMVIDHAERMGLSQLHQLRGRVGRGAAKSLCVLLYQPPLSEMAKARLKVMFESNDGFVIAQADLHMRGPGEFLGTRQSGAPLLKIADLERDADILQHAQRMADKLLNTHPQAVDAHLQRWLGKRGELVKV